MNKFNFIGDWETKLVLDKFSELLNSSGAYTGLVNKPNTGEVDLIIEDDLSDNPDPSDAQINAINYLIENQNLILEKCYQEVYSNYDNLKEIYGYDEDDIESNFPKLNSYKDSNKSFGIGILHVFNIEKDDYAYIGFEGGCTWDDEHGIGFIFHKDRLIRFGDATASFDAWPCYDDNGTSEQKQKEWKENNSQHTKKPKPIKYKAHPKYGKLKPSQAAENKAYEYRLLERGYNDDFIQLFETGQLNVDDRTGYINMSFLERACQFNNPEAALYLLSKKPKDIDNCLNNSVRHLNKDLSKALLEYGADINASNNVGETPLNSVLSIILSYYFHGGSKEIFEGAKDMIVWLFENGADPYIKNSKGRNAFDSLTYLKEPEKETTTKFIVSTFEKHKKKSNGNWKFWKN